MANAPTPSDGDWARFDNGQIGYTGFRRPRFITVALPDGLRESWTYKTSGGQVTLTGATSIQIQIGWIYEGRLRYKAAMKKWLPATFFPTTEILSGGTETNFTLLANNAVCNLQNANGKNFWQVEVNGLNVTKTESKTWFAISNGNGTVRWERY